MELRNLPDIIRNALAERIGVSIKGSDPSYRQSAVLIPIFHTDGEYRILFTKRTNNLDVHRGQISFPGGSVDKTDASPEETALREAYEEIGLRREDVTVLGRTDDARTMTSKYIVHPFVGLIPYPYDFRISQREVERLIEVPFRVFLPDGKSDKILPIEYEGGTYTSLSYVYEGEVIWGATARIMKNFIEILSEKLGLPAQG